MKSKMDKREWLWLVVPCLAAWLLLVLAACGGLLGSEDDALEGLEGDAEDGPVLSYHREGGIAGFCDDVTVFANGEVTVASCASDPPQAVGSTTLSEAQMRMLEQWVNELASFDDEQTDPAVADVMTINIAFQGNGEREATEEELQAMQLFAQELLVQASEPTE
jgi:hypothetical protein